MCRRKAGIAKEKADLNQMRRCVWKRNQTFKGIQLIPKMKKRLKEGGTNMAD